MRLDELYKFCDGTLTSVRSVLHDIASSLRMDYLPKRSWSKLDRRRSRIMIKVIDQQLFERRLMRNLEKFIDSHHGPSDAMYNPHQPLKGRQNRGQADNARGAGVAGNEGFPNRVGNANPGQNSEYFKDKMLLMQAQENRVVLDEDQLLFIAGRQTNMFDDDVDEAPVQDLALNKDNTMFMVNLSSVDPIYDEAGPSYDSDILSEVPDHNNYLHSVSEYHEVHEMQNDVQPNYVVDSDAEYMSDRNIIPYEQK
ncbi:hypothetical protein Tco_0641288 [Tanacetum coccineum]